MPVDSLLGATAAPALAQYPYSSTIFIGDSLSDAGYFGPLQPEFVRPVTGQFTTNPGWVWPQQISNYYGTNAGANGNGQTGDNYAAGSARVGIDLVNELGFVPPPRLRLPPTWQPMAATPMPRLCTQSGAAPTTCLPSPRLRRARQ